MTIMPMGQLRKKRKEKFPNLVAFYDHALGAAGTILTPYLQGYLDHDTVFKYFNRKEVPYKVRMDDPVRRSPSVTSDPQLDEAFFSPPDPRERNFLIAHPTIGVGLLFATGVMLYRMKQYPKYKAKGYDMQVYVLLSRGYVSLTFICVGILSITPFVISRQRENKKNNVTDGDLRRAFYGDTKPRKLPKQTLKSTCITDNPMVLIKTNILETVLLEKFKAKVD